MEEILCTFNKEKVLYVKSQTYFGELNIGFYICNPLSLSQQTIQDITQKVDGVVVVIDSRTHLLDCQINMFEYLNKAAYKLPIVMQYNKQNFRNVLATEKISLNFKHKLIFDEFPAITSQNLGVKETFLSILMAITKKKYLEFCPEISKKYLHSKVLSSKVPFLSKEKKLYVKEFLAILSILLFLYIGVKLGAI
ncbi:hypothetical protein [Candidatus Uabimicrobium sp. HlEnr_7]|uniref:hypothetical protein n=1 Tax=Candidatus Uabimicrobium helgolandensis TaxID=3095367 RepID=UPI00355866ED